MAIGVLLVDGSIMTRKRKLDKVINIIARSIAQTNEEIAIILAREIGKYLTSILNLNIDLYNEKRGDWSSFKSLLRECFQSARQFSNDSYITPASLDEQEYLNFISAVQSFIKRIRQALGSDWEVHAELLEIVENLNKLETLMVKANYPSTVQDVTSRCHMLGGIGELLIDSVESTPKIRRKS